MEQKPGIIPGTDISILTLTYGVCFVVHLVCTTFTQKGRLVTLTKFWGKLASGEDLEFANLEKNSSSLLETTIPY